MNVLRDAGAEGRLGKIKSDEKRLWNEQAAALGWRHQTALDEVRHQRLTDEERFDRAYRFAARHLAREFHTAAVITHEKLGMYAARALIGDVSPNPRKFRRGSRWRELSLQEGFSGKLVLATHAKAGL